MRSGDVSLLASEKSFLEGMIAETPEEDVLDLASLRSRLEAVLAEMSRLEAETPPDNSGRMPKVDFWPILLEADDQATRSAALS